MSRIFRTGATRLIEGVGKFQARVFGQQEKLFRKLEGGQHPGVLFVTCSDSRVNPNLLTQTEPGELFILRNAGNLVPPHGSPASGEEATVEYAVNALRVREIIVCGHSKCGAVGGLLNPASLDPLPAVRGWLAYAAGVKEDVDLRSAGLPADGRLRVGVERNVLKQLANLKTHPPVASALAEGRLRLHAWVYHFETGAVDAYDPGRDQFVPLAQAPRQGFGAGDVPVGPVPPADRSI